MAKYSKQDMISFAEWISQNYQQLPLANQGTGKENWYTYYPDMRTPDTVGAIKLLEEYLNQQK